MQFKIPQNVQMEDKIVGPVTLRQMVILGAGGGIDYFIYVALAKTHGWQVWILPVAIIAIITLAMAFVKIKGIPFIQYAFLSIEFYFKPRQRVWNQGGGDIFQSVTIPVPKTKEELAQDKQQKKPTKEIKNLEELTKILDTQSGMLTGRHEEQAKDAPNAQKTADIH